LGSGLATVAADAGEAIGTSLAAPQGGWGSAAGLGKIGGAVAKGVGAVNAGAAAMGRGGIETGFARQGAGSPEGGPVVVGAPQQQRGGGGGGMLGMGGMQSLGAVPPPQQMGMRGGGGGGAGTPPQYSQSVGSQPGSPLQGLDRAYGMSSRGQQTQPGVGNVYSGAPSIPLTGQQQVGGGGVLSPEMFGSQQQAQHQAQAMGPGQPVPGGQSILGRFGMSPEQQKYIGQQFQQQMDDRRELNMTQPTMGSAARPPEVGTGILGLMPGLTQRQRQQFQQFGR
jgi:hypothetical protein